MSLLTSQHLTAYTAHLFQSFQDAIEALWVSLYQEMDAIQAEGIQQGELVMALRAAERMLESGYTLEAVKRLTLLSEADIRKVEKMVKLPQTGCIVTAEAS